MNSDEKKRKFEDVTDCIAKAEEKKERKEIKEKRNQNKRIKSADDGISVYCVPVNTVLKWRYFKHFFYFFVIMITLVIFIFIIIIIIIIFIITITIMIKSVTIFFF